MYKSPPYSEVGEGSEATLAEKVNDCSRAGVVAGRTSEEAWCSVVKGAEGVSWIVALGVAVGGDGGMMVIEVVEGDETNSERAGMDTEEEKGVDM